MVEEHNLTGSVDVFLKKYKKAITILGAAAIIGMTVGAASL